MNFKISIYLLQFVSFCLLCSFVYSFSVNLENAKNQVALNEQSNDQANEQNQDLSQFARVKRPKRGFGDFINLTRERAREGLRLGARASIAAGKRVNEAACKFWNNADRMTNNDGTYEESQLCSGGGSGGSGGTANNPNDPSSGNSDPNNPNDSNNSNNSNNPNSDSDSNSSNNNDSRTSPSSPDASVDDFFNDTRNNSTDPSRADSNVSSSSPSPYENGNQNNPNDSNNNGSPDGRSNGVPSNVQDPKNANNNKTIINIYHINVSNAPGSGNNLPNLSELKDPKALSDKNNSLSTNPNEIDEKKKPKGLNDLKDLPKSNDKMPNSNDKIPNSIDKMPNSTDPRSNDKLTKPSSLASSTPNVYEATRVPPITGVPPITSYKPSEPTTRPPFSSNGFSTTISSIITPGPNTYDSSSLPDNSFNPTFSTTSPPSSYGNCRCTCSSPNTGMNIGSNSISNNNNRTNSGSNDMLDGLLGGRSTSPVNENLTNEFEVEPELENAANGTNPSNSPIRFRLIPKSSPVIMVKKSNPSSPISQEKSQTVPKKN